MPASSFESPLQPLEACDFSDLLARPRVIGIAELASTHVPVRPVVHCAKPPGANKPLTTAPLTTALVPTLRTVAVTLANQAVRPARPVDPTSALTAIGVGGGSTGTPAASE